MSMPDESDETRDVSEREADEPARTPAVEEPSGTGDAAAAQSGSVDPVAAQPGGDEPEDLSGLASLSFVLGLVAVAAMVAGLAVDGAMTIAGGVAALLLGPVASLLALRVGHHNALVDRYRGDLLGLWGYLLGAMATGAVLGIGAVMLLSEWSTLVATVLGLLLFFGSWLVLAAVGNGQWGKQRELGAQPEPTN